MTEHILIITEGEKREPQIIENIKNTFLKNSQIEIVKTSFKNNIYSLFRKIKDDGDLDLISLIKEMKLEGWEKIQSIPRQSFSQIFLIFDYDPHDTKAKEFNLNELISLFQEETEQGKLYLSYPMTEALWHIKDSEQFHASQASINDCANYKRIVHEQGGMFKWNAAGYTEEQWKSITKLNIIKAYSHIKPLEKSKIDKKELIENYRNTCSQSKILNHQNNNSPNFLILSCFPFLMADYFGVEKFYDV